MKYKCKVKGCNYETDSRFGFGGHMGGHSRRAKKGGTRAKLPIPQQDMPTPSDIADALLSIAVDAINKEQSLLEQLKVANSRIANLTGELTKTTVERDRVVKLHNEQVRYARKHSTELPDTETLMKVAKLR